MDQLWADAVRITSERLGMVLLVQPGIKLIEADGKAPASELYVEHVNTVIIGLLMSKCSDDFTSAVVMLKRDMTNLKERTETLMEFSQDYFPELMFLQETSSLM